MSAWSKYVLVKKSNEICICKKIDLYFILDCASTKRHRPLEYRWFIIDYSVSGNVYSSPATPHHSWTGASGLFWWWSAWSSSSLPACCCPPVCSQSGSLNDVSPELVPLSSLFPPSGTQESAGDVSLLSDRRTPLPELYSLFESAPRAMLRQRGVWTDGERTSINKHDMRGATLPRNSHMVLTKTCMEAFRGNVALVQKDRYTLFC